jgi:chromosome partitioning protein
MPRRIAWLSEKGGVGKTTSAINTAVGLAKLGHRTLVIDSDPQGNASLVLLGGEPAKTPTLHQVLVDEADAIDAIRPTATPGLDIIPTGASLADANLALAGELGRERRLRVAMEEVEDNYDFIVLDTSPARSLLTVNVMCYVREILVPVDPGLFSLSGLGQLQQAVEEVRRFLDNRALRIAGIVLTRMARNNVAREVEAQIRDQLGELVHPTTIPTATAIEEAHSRFQSVLDYSPRSTGGKAYAALVREIIANGQRQRTQDGTRDGGGGIAPADHAA